MTYLSILLLIEVIIGVGHDLPRRTFVDRGDCGGWT